MSDKFGFGKLQNDLKAAQRETLVFLSSQATNYFVSSWDKQAFDGVEWKEVQRRDSGINPNTGKQYSAYLYPKTKGLQRRTKPILVGAGYKKRGGALRRAVSAMARTATIGQTELKMIVDLPYAAAHNYGEGKMPKRTFVGQTQELTDMQNAKISEIIGRCFKL